MKLTKQGGNLMSFNGFSSNTLEFLIENRLNNSKSWYDEHKTEYNNFVLSPLKELVCDLSSYMLEIDPFLEVTPATNKTISRIYRDTRFSKDKSLFRINMWLVFTRPKKSWPDFPAFFFEVFPDKYRYGVGHYQASRETMDAYRKLIHTNHPVFRKALSCYESQHTFQLMGDPYKKSLVPGNPDNIKEWYDQKNIYFEHVSTNLKPLFSKNLVTELRTEFNTLGPIYRFLCEGAEKDLNSSF
jgi:uncharacterized protein (TIGR02453 family)